MGRVTGCSPQDPGPPRSHFYAFLSSSQVVPAWGRLFYIRWRRQGKRGHHLCGCKEASVHAACRLASVAALVSPQAPVSNLSPMLYKPARLPQRFSREALVCWNARVGEVRYLFVSPGRKLLHQHPRVNGLTQQTLRIQRLQTRSLRTFPSN